MSDPHELPLSESLLSKLSQCQPPVVLSDIVLVFREVEPLVWSKMWRLADEGYVDHKQMMVDKIFVITEAGYALLGGEVHCERGQNKVSLCRDR